MTCPGETDKPADGDRDAAIADPLARFLAWVLSAGGLVALLIPLFVVLAMYDMFVVQHPMRRGSGLSTNETVLAWLVQIACVALYGLRLACRQVLTGQSAGMRCVGIEVVSFASGGRITYRAALSRMLLPLLAAVPVTAIAISTGSADYGWLAIAGWLLCPISALWGQMGRGWHDRLAGTVLLKADIENNE